MYKQPENSDLYIHLYMHKSAFAVHLTLKQLNVPLNVPHRGTIAGQTAPKGENVPPNVPLSGTFAGQQLPLNKIFAPILDNYIGRRYTRATIYRKPI